MASRLLSPVGFLRQAYLAITDFRFYRTVFQQPFGYTVVYLGYLTIVGAMVMTAVYGWYILPEWRKALLWASTNLPTLEVREGRLSVDASLPIRREYLGDYVVTFIIRDNDDPEEIYRVSPPAALLGPEQLAIVLPNGDIQTWAWQELRFDRFSPEDWVQLEAVIGWLFIPGALLLEVARGLLLKTIQALLMTLLALSASARYGVRLPFSNYLTITVYALTPAAVIDLGIALTWQAGAFFEFAYLVTAAIYTYMATQKCVAIE